MTVKTLIEKLSHYNKDAIVRLHHREGEELLFALAFQKMQHLKMEKMSWMSILKCWKPELI